LGVAGQDPAEQVQPEFHRVVEQEASFKSHEHVVPGEVDLVVVGPVGGGDVVVVIDVVSELARIYLLRPERAAIGLGSNMGAMVVND